MSQGFSQRGDTLLVEIVGELDMANADFWRQTIDKELLRTGARNLAFNFANISFIDSSGLGIILGRFRLLSQYGGKVSVINAPANIYKILTMSGLGKVIKIASLEGEGA